MEPGRETLIQKRWSEVQENAMIAFGAHKFCTNYLTVLRAIDGMSYVIYSPLKSAENIVFDKMEDHISCEGMVVEKGR